MKLQQNRTSARSCEGQPLFYVVDWLPPHFGAVGQYAVIDASERAANGRNVVLIGLTSGAASITEQNFPRGGFLRTIRISAGRYDKSRMLSRLMWTLRTDARLISKVVWSPNARQAELMFTG